MASAGPNYPGTVADDSSVGSNAWSNPTNAEAVDGSSARAVNSSNASHYLKATNHGFSIPSNATINGIVLEVVCAGTTVGTDNSVKLVKGGTIGGTDKSTGASLLGTMVYGGASDLWGLSWAPSDINASTFGAAFSSKWSGSGQPTDVDAMRITVFYNTPSGPNNPATVVDAAPSYTSVAWSNPTNAKAQDGNLATVALTDSTQAHGTSHFLQATNFGFSIPSNAHILGVQFDELRKAGSSSAQIVDNSVLLLVAGATTGNDKASGTAWAQGTSLGTGTYGSASDVWGANLMASDINNSSFGIQHQVKNQNGVSTTVAIDMIQCTVTYTTNWFVDSATGTVKFGGTVSESRVAADAATGTLKLGGSGQESYQVANIFNDARTGTLILGGTASHSSSANHSATGTLKLGGSGVEGYAQLAPAIPAAAAAEVAPVAPLWHSPPDPDDPIWDTPYAPVMFPGTAGQLQAQGTGDPNSFKFVAFHVELGQNYATYHTFLAIQIANIGARPNPSGFTDHDQYTAACSKINNLLAAEMLLRHCYQAVSGHAADTYPLVDSAHRLVSAITGVCEPGFSDQSPAYSQPGWSPWTVQTS